jgi:hypothetical protein
MNSLPTGYKVILNLGSLNSIDVTTYGNGTCWYPPENADISPLMIIKDTTLTINIYLPGDTVPTSKYICPVSVINPVVALFKTHKSTYIVDRGVAVNLQWVADAKYCCLHGDSLGISIVKQPPIVNNYTYTPKETSLLGLIPFYDKDLHGSPSFLHFVVRNPQLSGFEVKSGESKQTFDETTPLIINARGEDIFKYDLSYEILDSKGMLHPLKSIATGLSNVKDYKWSLPDAKWAVKGNQGHGPSYPLRVTFHAEGYSDAYGTDGQGPTQILKHIMTPKFLDDGHVKIIYLRAANPDISPSGLLRLEFLVYGIESTYIIEGQAAKITGSIIYPWAPQTIEIKPNIDSTIAYKMSVKNIKGYKDSTTYIKA